MVSPPWWIGPTGRKTVLVVGGGLPCWVWRFLAIPWSRKLDQDGKRFCYAGQCDVHCAVQ